MLTVLSVAGGRGAGAYRLKGKRLAPEMGEIMELEMVNKTLFGLDIVQLSFGGSLKTCA